MPNNENNNYENFNNSNSTNPGMLEQPMMPMQPTIQSQPIAQEQATQPQQVQQELEIPQTYYEKIAKEQAEEEMTKQTVQPEEAPKEEGGLTKKVIPLIIVNALLIFAFFYATVNVNVLISAATLIYVALGSIIFAIKDKQKSEFPVSVIIGGMISAVVCFVISMISDDGMDLWTYYASACALTGFIGLIVANITTKLLTDIKNVKALQTIGYLLFFAVLIAGPYLAYQKWPTEFYQIVFFQQNEVVAETYEEYVLKTLKARYNINFTCNFAEKHNYKTEKNELMSTVPCSDPNGNNINVRTIVYNESENKYTVIDDFMEKIYFTEIKEMISAKVKQATGATEVTTYLYPKTGCIFVGDCADCTDYYKVYSEVNDPKNRYELSSSINLSKYLNLSNDEFIKKYINENEFKVILNLKGAYDKNYTDFKTITNQALASLNTTGLKNTYGYEITFYDYQVEKYETKEHTEIGNTNETKEFK